MHRIQKKRLGCRWLTGGTTGSFPICLWPLEICQLVKQRIQSFSTKGRLCLLQLLYFLKKRPIFYKRKEEIGIKKHMLQRLCSKRKRQTFAFALLLFWGCLWGFRQCKEQRISKHFLFFLGRLLQYVDCISSFSSVNQLTVQNHHVIT